MRHSEDIKDIAKAMNAMQAAMKPALKDSKNPFYKSVYSDITSVWDAIREPMTNNGLSVWQDVETEGKTIRVTTRIVHATGQWVEFGPLCLESKDLSPQAIGSIISYGKRYALCAACGVVSATEAQLRVEDDDGEAGQEAYRKPEPSPAPAFVTTEQVKQIKSLLKESDLPKFIKELEAMKIPGLAAIPQDRFKGVIAYINSTYVNKEEAANG